MISLKPTIIFAILVGAYCLNLEFEEDGSQYTEKIVIDENKNTVEYDVPQHGRVDASKYFSDIVSGQTVLKLDTIRQCYLIKVTKDGPKIDSIKAGLKKVKGKFPRNRYLVEKHNYLPLYEMERSKLSPSILTFCGNYPIIKVVAGTASEMEKIALKAAKGHKNNVKRQLVTRTYTRFTSCKSDSSYTIETCPENKLQVTCGFRTAGTCVYRINCSINSFDQTFTCPAVHSYSFLHCCDYTCQI